MLKIITADALPGNTALLISPTERMLGESDGEYVMRLVRENRVSKIAWTGHLVTPNEGVKPYWLHGYSGIPIEEE